jgi:hypothetical protein
MEWYDLKCMYISLIKIKKKWKSCNGLIIYGLRPAQEYFTYMETSPLPVKGCKI